MVHLEKLSTKKMRWVRVFAAAWFCIWLLQAAQGFQGPLCESRATLLFSAPSQGEFCCQCCCKDTNQEAFPYASCQTEQSCSGPSIPNSQEPVFTPTVSTQQFQQIECVSEKVFSPGSFHRLNPLFCRPWRPPLQVYLLNQILLI